MQSKTFQFKCDSSMLMKALAVFIQKASQYQSKIYLHLGDRKANAKSLLGVMSLGIEDGSSISLSCEGLDENLALETLLQFLQEPQTDCMQ